MLTITFPGKEFLPEYRYVAGCIFSHFLHTDWQHNGYTPGYWTLTDGCSTVQFPNILFPEQDPASWLTPSMPSPEATSVAAEPQLPPFPYALPGARTLQDVDIFGSIFFLLAAVEHQMNLPLDKFGNLEATATFLGKNDLLSRPVVDEYIAHLLFFLLKLGIPCADGDFSYSLKYSCDIDTPTLWFTCDSINTLKYLLAAFIKHKSFQRARSIIKSKVDINFDLYYTFPFIFSELDSVGLCGQFNVMGGVTNPKFDFEYHLSEIHIQNLLNDITIRGHKIGFHPSFDTIHSEKNFSTEYRTLCDYLGYPVKSGRQHYLRFAGSSTWQMWDDAGLSSDSTCGYSRYIGFRLGTSRPFKVYNIKQRRKLNLTEYPLIIMDCSLYSDAATDEDICERALRLNQEVRKHKGTMTFLWHNHFFEDDGKCRMFRRLLRAFA